jgi:hypothetical protein
MEIILLRVVEECVHFFQNLLVILGYLFEVDKILNQGSDPSPSILVRFRFATINVLYQFEDTMAELFFFV